MAKDDLTLDAKAEHAPRVTVWANGFGVWHVRVPRHAVAPLLGARRALRDELKAREANVDRDVWLHPVRVEELDDADTIVYREASPGEDTANHHFSAESVTRTTTRRTAVKIPEGLMVGLFEWDGSREPVIIIGTDEDAIYKAAVPHCLYQENAGAPVKLGWGAVNDPWLAEHPVPDLGDAAACKAWMLALADDDEHRSSTEFNIWHHGQFATVIEWVVPDGDDG